MNNQCSLTGKHALVTGGIRGIGCAIAEGFLEAGPAVYFASDASSFTTAQR